MMACGRTRRQALPAVGVTGSALRPMHTPPLLETAGLCFSPATQALRELRDPLAHWTRTRSSWRTRALPSPPKRAHEAAGTRRERVDQLANLGEPSAQLGVADLDRHQRVLERDELAFRVPDRTDGVLDEALYAGRRRSRRRRREGTGRQSMTAGEACVGALGTTVGALNGPEQLLLQAISLLIV